MSKTKPTKLPIGDRLRRAFAAATGDLQPRGRLPKGMTEDQATRSLLAFAGYNLERFAAAAEAMHKILAEDYDDGDDEPGDETWDDTPELRPQESEPGSPSLPGTIPTGSATPQRIQELLGEQDRETCRRFAIELLAWVRERIVGEDRPDAVLTELRRDLEMMETFSIALVARLYEAASKPVLIKPDSADLQAEQTDAHQVDERSEMVTDDA